MLNQTITVDGKLFLGRIEEQKRFQVALEEAIKPAPDELLPYVILPFVILLSLSFLSEIELKIILQFQRTCRLKIVVDTQIQ